MAIAEAEDKVVDDQVNTEIKDGEMPPNDPEDDPDEEVIVSIGEPPAEPEDDDTNVAPAWVKDLRKSDREKSKRIRELEALVEAKQAPEKAETALTKPTLAGCEYDEEDFERKLDAYKAQQAKVAEDKRKKEDAEKSANEAWQGKLNTYNKSKVELKVQDFEDAEAAAISVLSVNQQGIIVNGSDNSALMIYAIGKNPAKAKELAAIADPVKFAFAIAKLETQLKVTPRKAPPPPEKVVRGSAPVSGATDTTLDKLRDEAAKTGDASKLMAYKRNLKSKQQ